MRIQSINRKNEIYDDEPYFFAANSHDLRFIEQTSETAALSLIHYELTRNPNSITNHIRKIYMLISMKLDTQELLLSTIVLFQLLGENGSTLKVRILDQLKPHLPASDWEILENSSCIGKQDFALQKPVCFDFIIDTEQEISSTDTMETVGSYIENCQLTEAIETLEDAIVNEPENEIWGQTLIDLYSSCGEEKRFFPLHEQLKRNNAHLPNCWSIAASKYTENIH